MLNDNPKITRFSDNRTRTQALESIQGGNAKNRISEAEMLETKKKITKEFSKKQLNALRKGLRDIKYEEKKGRQKLSGVGFWIILSINIVEDILDTILTLTGVGSIVFGITTTLLAGVTLLYLRLSGVKLGTRKMATTIVAWVVDVFGIPTNTILLIVLRILENNRLAKVVAEKNVGLVKNLGTK